MTDEEIRDLFGRHLDREITDDDVATFRRQLDEYNANYQRHLEAYKNRQQQYR